MLGMGMELGFSQGGNNNAYDQDNATSAIHWASADASLIAFTARLISARRGNPALRRDAFLTGSPFDASGLPDVEWRDADGPLTQSGWNDLAGAVLVVVFAAAEGDSVDRVAVAMNRSGADVEIRLPAPRSGMAWRALIDTHDPDAPERRLALADRGRLKSRSSLILAEARTARGAPARERPRPRRSIRSPARRASRANGGTSRASARSFRRKPRSRFSPDLASKSRPKLEPATA